MVRRAHAEYPLACVQTEYSLATRDIETEILSACRELGIGFVAYAPLTRGLLSGEIRNLADLEENDRRHALPRVLTLLLKPMGVLDIPLNIPYGRLASCW